MPGLLAGDEQLSMPMLPAGLLLDMHAAPQPPKHLCPSNVLAFNLTRRRPVLPVGSKPNRLAVSVRKMFGRAIRMDPDRGVI